MTASEMVTQFHMLAAFQAITAIVWLMCAATAASRYWQHHQRLELGWAVAFAMLAFGAAVDGYAAYRMSGEFEVLTAGPASLFEFEVFYRLRMAAVVMVAAFAMLLLFRRRPVVLPPSETE